MPRWATVQGEVAAAAAAASWCSLLALLTRNLKQLQRKGWVKCRGHHILCLQTFITGASIRISLTMAVMQCAWSWNLAVCGLKDETKPHTAPIPSSWLCYRRLQVLNCPACSPDLSAENIWSIMKEKHDKTQECWEAGILHQTRMDDIPLPKVQQRFC